MDEYAIRVNESFAFLTFTVNNYFKKETCFKKFTCYWKQMENWRIIEYYFFKSLGFDHCELFSFGIVNNLKAQSTALFFYFDLS
jgi:hypothetical protein